MRQRGQVAAGAQGALLVHDRQHAPVVEIEQALHGGQLHAAVAVAQALHLQQQHQAYQLGGYFLARAAGVRHEQVGLQLLALVGSNNLAAQSAEASIDAIHHGLGRALQPVLQVLVAVRDALADFGAERPAGLGAQQLVEGGEVEVGGGGEDEILGHGREGCGPWV